MNRIKRILAELYSLNEEFDISYYAPRDSNLYMTIANPATSPSRIVEFAVKMSKSVLDNLVYDFICYRDGYDIGTYTIILTISLNDYVMSWVDYPFTPFQLLNLISWLRSLQNKELDVSTNKFNLIGDDSVNVRIDSEGYYITYSKKHKEIDDTILQMTHEEFDKYIEQLELLASKVNVNSSVYNYYRLHQDDNS